MASGLQEKIWEGVIAAQRAGMPDMASLPAAAALVAGSSYETNYNVTASYTNPQTPQGIALDLQALLMMSR